MSATRQVKSDKQTKQVSGSAKPAELDRRVRRTYDAAEKIKLKAKIPDKSYAAPGFAPLPIRIQEPRSENQL